MTFELPMRSTTTRFVVGFIALSAFALFAYPAEMSFFADRLAKIPLFGTELAIKSEPQNPRYEYELGNYWLIAAQQPQIAKPHFERATRLDPYNGRYWGQLAVASQEMGEVERARDALARSLTADPTTPELLWEAANLYAFLGDKEKSLDAMHRFVLASPDQLPIAAQLGWRTTRDAGVLLDRVLPRGANSDLSLLIALVRGVDPAASARIKVLDVDPTNYFVHNLVQLAFPSAQSNVPAISPVLGIVAEKEKVRTQMLRLIDVKSGRDWTETEAEIALQHQQRLESTYRRKQEEKQQQVADNADVFAAGAFVWERLMAERQKFDVRLAFPYIQMLIDSNQEDASIHAWSLLVSREQQLRNRSTGNNLVQNGSFEFELLNGGFDWQYATSDENALAIDHLNARDGGSSLLMRFKDKPVADVGIVQYVPVKANTQYEFTGYLRADSLMAATGPRFLVKDVDAEEPYFESADLRGTVNWTKFSGQFTTSASAHFIEIRMIRDPGNTLIKGQAWADAISLVQVQGN